MSKQQNPAPLHHPPARFFALDVLRGVAAMTVVLNHWKHFSFVGTDAANALDRSGSPFYAFLFPFYEYGWMAVDLFFGLSGFIFYAFYSQRVFKQTISVTKFALLRFSRLYPLHFLTLVVVAILQFIALMSTGAFVVYPANDTFHFLTNLFFVPLVGLNSGQSFNAPIWSVSVELIMYALFFTYCRLFRPSRVVLLLFLVVAGAGLYGVRPFIARGIMSFFLGGIVFNLYTYLTTHHDLRKTSNIAGLITLLLWGTIALVLTLPETVADPILFQRVIFWKLLIILGVFPTTILTLALLGTVNHNFMKRFSFLGNWSYGIYLWHFPLQLALILLAGSLSLDTSVFQTGWALFCFMGLLLLLAAAGYRYVEHPAQDFLRKLY